MNEGHAFTLIRGQIVLVSLDPAIGSEAAKARPAVVVSNNAANGAATRSGAGVITVVPLTTNTTRVLPFHVLVPADRSGLATDSKAQAEQVRAVWVARVVRPLGWVPTEFMGAIDEALRVHLSL